MDCVLLDFTDKIDFFFLPFNVNFGPNYLRIRSFFSVLLFPSHEQEYQRNFKNIKNIEVER